MGHILTQNYTWTFFIIYPWALLCCAEQLPFLCSEPQQQDISRATEQVQLEDLKKWIRPMLLLRRRGGEKNRSRWESKVNDLKNCWQSWAQLNRDFVFASNETRTRRVRVSSSEHRLSVRFRSNQLNCQPQNWRTFGNFLEASKNSFLPGRFIF